MCGYLLGVALCAGLIASWPTSGHAQATYPTGEFFLGGSKLWARSDSTRYQNHGLQGSITGNFYRFVGIEMELGGSTNYSRARRLTETDTRSCSGHVLRIVETPA